MGLVSYPYAVPAVPIGVVVRSKTVLEPPVELTEVFLPAEVGAGALSISYCTEGLKWDRPRLPVGVDVGALAVHLALEELPRVLGAALETEASITVLQVAQPLALVARVAAGVVHHSVAGSLPLMPLAVVHGRSLLVGHRAASVPLVPVPLTFITALVFIDAFAMAFPLVPFVVEPGVVTFVNFNAYVRTSL